MSIQKLLHFRGDATRAIPLQPHLSAPQVRALRAAVAAYRRGYEANGWTRTAGGKFWVRNAEAALEIVTLHQEPDKAA